MSKGAIQDIPFRRGLNIIWSPTGTGPDALATGHAAGKTLLCRLVRYCLGEDSFADPEDTEAIRTRFPSGGVGAEVRLRGQTWVVRRRFVTPRDDRAQRGESIRKLMDDGLRGSFICFREEIEKAVFDQNQSDLLADMEEVKDAWQYVLAWLTRDQECRMDGLTHWRHKDSSSHSPAHSATIETRLNVLRVAIGLYSSEASTLRQKIVNAASLVRVSEIAARRSEAHFDALQDELAAVLGVDADRIWPPPAPTELLQDQQSILDAHRKSLIALADERIRSLRAVSIDPDHVRDDEQLAESVSQLARVTQQIKNLERDVELKEQRMQLLQAEAAKGWANVREAKHPTCPYDGTLLDVERAQFVCPLPRIPDPTAASKIVAETDATRERIQSELSEDRESLKTLRGDQAGLGIGIAAKQRTIKAYELALTTATKESQAAWATKGQIRRLFEQRSSADQALQAEKDARESLKKLYELQASGLPSFSTSKLQRWFDYLIQRVLTPEAHGTIVLDGNGLHPKINWHGNRRSVALNSLQIVLFDLAAMLCAVEGDSKAPAFLVHDSPREGDLDPWAYARLFEAIYELGQDENTAAFQYIVTTTTDPPEGRVRSRVRLQISADSDEHRLFRVDL